MAALPHYSYYGNFISCLELIVAGSPWMIRLYHLQDVSDLNWLIYKQFQWVFYKYMYLLTLLLLTNIP